MATPNPDLDLAVMRHTKSMIGGMQLAVVLWPQVLTPDQVKLKAEQDYLTMFTQFPQVTQLLSRDSWIEFYVRGYAWQSTRLIELWGYNNHALAAAILEGE